MSKILKNNSGSSIDISDVGITIANATNYTIPPNDYLLWAASIDVASRISAGDIVVNDGYSDLNASDGLAFIEYPDTALSSRFLSEPERSNGFTAKNIQEAIEQSRSSGIGTVLEFHFSAGTNNTNNAWLTHHDPSAPSNDVPAITPQQVEVKGVTFSNKDDSSNTDIEVYKNNVLVATVEVRNKRYYWKVGATLATFSQADRMSVYLKKYGLVQDAPSKPQVSVYCKIVTEGALTGGEQYGD